MSVPKGGAMKSKKRDTMKQSETTKVDHTIPFFLVPREGKFILPDDSNGLCLGILIRRPIEGPNRFRGNAVTSTGEAVHIGASIKVERVQ